MVAGHGLRGTRAASGPAGVSPRGELAPRARHDYYCAAGHVTSVAFALEADVPAVWDCGTCGGPAGTDATAPPAAVHDEPYKTHLEYVLERRTDAEGEALLAEALSDIAKRRKG